MKITEARVIVCSPGRNFVTLKIVTDQGIYGLGDATLNGREKAVAAYLEEHCIPALIGMNPENTEDIWHYFYRGAYWKGGPVTMTAIAAIDMALWDIRGKSLNVPVYKLLGGKSRDRVLVYAHANGVSLQDAVEKAGIEIKKGFKAVRVQCAVPGVSHAYGIARDGRAYEPAAKGLPETQVFDTGKYLDFIPEVFASLRAAYGTDISLLHDVHHRCTPIEAARLARDLEPFHLFWLEDPVAGELKEGLRLIRNHSVTPIAIGEVFNTGFDFTTLITEQLIDFIRMPLAHGGGVTHLQKLAAFASFYQVRTGFHGATDLSPVNLAASLHFSLAVNNFGILEYMPHQEVVHEVFSINYSLSEGHLQVSDAPGFGVDLDEEKARKYPYTMASLPVGRREDGTLWYW